MIKNEKEGVKLTPGKKTNKDLAEWFGVRPQSYSNKKKDFLKKLEEYAIFEINDAGKVNILEVIEPYYINVPVAANIDDWLQLAYTRRAGQMVFRSNTMYKGLLFRAQGSFRSGRTAFVASLRYRFLYFLSRLFL